MHVILDFLIFSVVITPSKTFFSLTHYRKYSGIVFSFFKILFGENTLFSIKLTNPLQMYPVILEYMYSLNIACILKIFCFNTFIIYKYITSSGLFSTPKLPKHVATLFLA